MIDKKRRHVVVVRESKSRSLVILLFCSALILSLVEIKVVSALRAADFFVVLGMGIYAWCNFRNPRISTLLVIYLFLVLAATVVVDFYASEEAWLGNLGFLYKYFLAIFLPLIAVRASAGVSSPERELNFLAKCLMIYLLLLITWPYIYNVLRLSGLFEAWHYRVSFLFSPVVDGRSDGHIYSAVLAITLLVYVLGLRSYFSHSHVTSFLVTSAGIGALLLTGSRGGLLVFAGAWTLYNVAVLHRRGFFSRSISIWIALGLLSTLGLVVLVMIHDSFSSIMRAIEFNFLGENSTLGRLQKMEYAWRGMAVDGLWFGWGLARADLKWFDSALAVMVGHFGLVGIALIVAWTGATLRWLLRLEKTFGYSVGTLHILIIAIVGINLVTEFALVTRALLPFVLGVCFLYLQQVSRSRCAAGKSDNFFLA